ncbi:MAG: hypothetical protein PVI59_11385 [Anaerolineae bacterium]|jgi:hypothetical protein
MMAEQQEKIELERSQFGMLLLKNPNYFGNLADSPFEAVAAMEGNTKYEELTCIGFNPKLDMLEATLQIKLPFGYGGGLCGTGSIEYVRFFIDYGDGWENLGVVGINVHDIPDDEDCAGHKDKPLIYVATLEIDPRRNFCGHAVLPKVRAILSWNEEPPDDNPDYPPVWGNVLERHIQIKPRHWVLADVVHFLKPELAEEFKLPPKFQKLALEPIPQPPDPPPLTLAQLVKVYTGPQKAQKAAVEAAVEPHRFGFSDLAAMMAPGVATQAKLTAKIAEWKQVKLDWFEALEVLENTSGDVSFEELNCVGLDPNREWLVATFSIKRPNGYLGDLCDQGSLEHVAFWADWDDTCTWTYLGTATVDVHDIADIPPEGLHYTAILKVNLDPHRSPCEHPKVGRVRAVLSWNSPPSTTNPNAIPHWGNRLDAHVQIKPGEPITEPLPKISILGGIGVADINVFGNGMTKTNARFALTGTLADNWGRLCPFGGQVVLQGTPVLGYRYRAVVRRFGTTDRIHLTHRIWTVDEDGVGTWRYPDADDFFTYLPDSQNIIDVLAYWYTAGDDLWEVRLEMAGPPPGGVIAVTPWHRVQLDNSRPDAEITIDAGACEMYAPGTVLTGHFAARDPHFGHFTLDTLPSTVDGVATPDPTTTTASTSQTALPPGDAWQLDTMDMKPCGYVVRVRVWDRTIRGSSPGHHNYNTDEKGFCLLKGPEDE